MISLTKSIFDKKHVGVLMPHLQNALTYFAAAISDTRKMFMKLTLHGFLGSLSTQELNPN
jgi:hypothetical protein